MEWQPIEKAYADKEIMQDQKSIIILTGTGAVEAWFCKGEWSDHYENGPEYSGDFWVCYDDKFSLEVETCKEDDGTMVYFSDVTHWMPLPTPPTT